MQLAATGSAARCRSTSTCRDAWGDVHRRGWRQALAGHAASSNIWVAGTFHRHPDRAPRRQPAAVARTSPGQSTDDHVRSDDFAEEVAADLSAPACAPRPICAMKKFPTKYANTVSRRCPCCSPSGSGKSKRAASRCADSAPSSNGSLLSTTRHELVRRSQKTLNESLEGRT